MLRSLQSCDKHRAVSRRRQGVCDRPELRCSSWRIREIQIVALLFRTYLQRVVEASLISSVASGANLVNFQ